MQLPTSFDVNMFTMAAFDYFDYIEFRHQIEFPHQIENTLSSIDLSHDIILLQCCSRREDDGSHRGKPYYHRVQVYQRILDVWNPSYLFSNPHIYFPTYLVFSVSFFFHHTTTGVCLCLSWEQFLRWEDKYISSSISGVFSGWFLSLSKALQLWGVYIYIYIWVPPKKKSLWVSHGPHYYFSLRYIWLSSVSKPSIPLLEQHRLCYFENDRNPYLETIT